MDEKINMSTGAWKDIDLLNQAVTYWPLLSFMCLTVESAIVDTIHRNNNFERSHMGL